MISSNRNYRSAAVIGCCLLFTIALAWIFFPPRQPEAAEKIVRESWRLMQEVGQYDFSTTVEQATFPAPALANVGQSSTKEIYQISGLTDLHNDTLEIRLFQNQGSLLNQTNGVEIRVAGDKASGRPIGSTEWQPLENISSTSYTFGSNGSTFLSAARNVREQASQTLEIPNRDGGTSAVSVTRYSFDVDPNEYAVLMRDQMVAELQRSGKLPLGMQLSVSDQYRAMLSSGEVWISDEGLPVRMSVTMKMPPEKTGEHVEATITTDYFNHRSGNLLASQPLPYQVAGALGLPTNPKALGELTLQLSLLAGCALLVVLMAAFSSKKFIYAGVAGLVILSMLVTPIWNGEKTAVFAKDIQAQNASIEAEQQEARQAREAYTAAYTSDWDPHTNPLDRIMTEPAASEPVVTGAVEQPVVFNSLIDEIDTAQTAGESGEADVDTDGDGLTDAYESESPLTVLNPNKADTDDDGLDDNIELKLNLFPGEKDTDSDGIWDNDEIRSFYAGDKDWYLNAEERDTDMDGQLDGAECPERANGTAGICRDTDSDQIPDVFDPDDDNDGIPTVYDESPYVLSSQVYSHTSPLKLTIDGVEAGKSTYINYQFIPTNEKHLTYTLSVLDWPTKDTDGQIQRVSDTVFSKSMTPGQIAQDPRSQFGDMRMIPMVEIKIPGSSIPFPMSDTVVVDFSITGLSGSFEFKADTTSSTRITLTKKFSTPEDQPISKVIKIGEGTCEEYDSVAVLDLHSVSDTTMANLSLGDLVDGRHVLSFFDAGSTDYLCSPIPAVAHGNSEISVIDSTALQAYGGAVRDDGEGSLLVYTPLTLVYDETGGRPVAFSTRIPYSNALNGLNGSEQEVRIVWLINMLTDECLAMDTGYNESASGTWCNPDLPERWNKDVSRIVHSYTEEFTLAGLSVVEDHGVEMAVIFEDPQVDLDPLYDDPLWGMASGLERTFLAGRADMNVNEIKNRFDPNTPDDSNPILDTDNRLWALGNDTFQVLRYSYPDMDGISTFINDGVARIFDDYFKYTGAPDVTNLLFARQITQRATSVGEAGQTCNASGCQLDLTDKPAITQAMLNWAPYQRKGDQWQPYDINEYLDSIEAHLRSLVDFKPEDDSPDARNVVDGQIAMAKIYYRALYSGVASLVAINGNPVINEPTIVSDENMYSDFRSNNSKGQLVAKVINTCVSAILNGFAKSPFLLLSVVVGTKGDMVRGLFKALGKGLAEKVSPITSRLTSTFRRVALGIGIAIAIAGIATLLILYLNGDNSPTGKWAGRILFTVFQVIAGVLAGAALVSAIKAVKCVSESAKIAAVIGAIIGVVITWGIFIYTWASTGVSFGSLAFNNMLAEAIAATITVVLLAALSATGVGAIIVAVIGLIDALIAAICEISGANEMEQDHWVRQYICIGITGWITKIIKWVIYSNTYLVDYDNGDRLSLNEVDQELENNSLGMSHGNHMKLSVGVDNTITKSKVPVDWKAAAYFWQYSDSNAKSTTFAYKLQATETDIHGSLNRGSISSQWESLGGSKWTKEFAANTDGFSIPVPQPGINQDPTVYLSEGSAVPVQECWAIPIFFPVFFLIPVCYIRTEKATVNSEISSALTVDVFPSTLDSFYSLAVDSETSGLKLAWGQTGSVKFPVLRDADGDGLMSRAYSGGNDPDDTLYDTDSDGLSDFYEIANSMNPRMVDSDDDGLSDYLEVLAKTSPTRKDTDGDGLTDAEEAAGWLYTYDFDSIGAPLETMVYPNPLSPDTDLDGVTDYLERVYGFHPGVPQNSDVLDYELTLREQDSPLVMLRLNENAGAMVFTDSANFGFAASCSADECPTAGIDGRYAAAARFDGSDLLRLPTTAKAISLTNNQPFTFAGWVNPASGGTLFAKWSDVSGSQQDVRLELTDDRHLRLVSKSTTASSSGTLPIGSWTFISAVFTGIQAPGEDNLFFYINGNAAGSTVFSTPPTVAGSLPAEITLGAYQGASDLTGYFQGDLDEMAVFDHALSAEDLADRWMAARYNFNDTFVRPGEEVVYQSTVTNLLNSRFAYGLLTTLIDKVDAIVDWATKLIPNTFVLYPDNPVVTGVNTETIETRLQIEPAHAVSEDVTITQTAEAQIVDRRSESNLAELWLQFEEGDAATSFVDNSGNMPPRDAACSDCPLSNQAGILNKAVRFQSGQSDRINLPTLGTLDLLNRGYTFSVWVRPMDTATAGARIPLLGSDSNRLSITLVRQADSSFKPEVLVNGVNQVNTVWRTMKASVWSHLVVEFFSATNTFKAYINGGEIVSTTATPLTAGANLWLGGGSAPTDFYVDDLRIFNRPLTITDVNRLAERTVLELNMDGTGFTNSSPYTTNVSTPKNWPTKNDNSVRGKSLYPGTSSSQGSLLVNGNPLLNMSDGSFTFSVWVYPTSGSPGQWQGIFGNRESTTDATAYPTLERYGRQLRFGFGNGSSYQSHTSGDLLTENKWNHVTITFAPNLLEAGNYTFRLYIDSVLKESKNFTSKPAASSSFYVGASSKSFTLTIGTLYMDDEHDAGDTAEVYIYKYVDGSHSTFMGDTDFDDGDSKTFNHSDTYSNFQTIEYAVWEDDSTSANDHCGTLTKRWYEMPGSGSLSLSNGFDGSLTWSFSRPSIQFYGLIDEMEVYRYAIDSEQVYDQYYAIPVSARLPLDDRPSSTSFENRAVIGALDDGTCSGANCPAAGTIGLINQAVRFDGINDVISVPVGTTSSYMVSLWIDSTCENCGVYSLLNGASVNHQLYLKNGNICSLANGQELCSQGGTITNGQWHYVVYTNNGSTANLWLDGAIVNTRAAGAVQTGATAKLGYASSAANPTLSGQLDDVRVFRYVQDAATIAAIQQRAPLFLSRLDEPDGSTIFDDATPSDFQLGCTGNACPTGGFEGRLRTAVEFNENADVLNLNQPALSAAATGFSVSLWIYPTQTKDTAQSIVTIANGANTQPRAAISFAPNSTYLTVQNAASMTTIPQSNVELIKNTWNQVTLVVERNAGNTGENYYLYINGYLDSSWATSQVNTGLGKITLGNASGIAGLQAGPYTGKIDEVAVYEYALNEIDIRETFAYQMGQVEETASLTMTIDADNPQAELISFNPSFPYMDENDRVLHVEAADATSGIGMIEMQVAHVNAPATQWKVAPVCQDAPGGTAFCPTFDPQHGEGAYTLSFRAVDQVGNQAKSDEYIFLVDASEPNVFVNLVEGSLQKAEPHLSMPNTWVLHMHGQVVDEILNQGQPGSGLDLDSMKVTVYSENNEVAGKGAQVPTLVPAENGYDWSLDYLFPEAEPTGALTVVIEVKDLVGNQAATTVHVLMDASAPSAIMESNQPLAGDAFDPLSLFDVNTQDEKMLSGGNVSGSVNDTPDDGIPYMTPNGKLATSGVARVEAAFEPSIDASYLFNEPYPEGLLAWLPLDDAKAPDGASGTPDEGAAERYFLDISPFQFSGFCTGANCPINGEIGHKNGSIYFDGQEKSINLGSKVDLANRSFSALVWARRDTAGHSDPFLWQGPFADAKQRFLFGLDYQDRLVCGFGGTDLLTADAFTDTGWHAYACTYDLDSGRRAIYRDGREVARDTAGAVPAMSEDMLIGYAPVGSFAGSLDELMVLDRALSADEVRTAYTGYQAVYHLTIDETFLSNGDIVPDESGYFHIGTLLSGEGDPTNKVVAGAVGNYGLHFDGNDRFVVDPAFSLALDRGAFTQTAWVKPAGGAGAIISQLDANPEQRYPSIYMTDQFGLIAGFGDLYDWNELATADGVVQPGAWNLIAARFDGTTYSLFVNGVEVAQTGALQGKQPYPADRFNLGEGFAGDIDDVQIFTRPLSNGEIHALAQTGWRSANLEGSTWSAPVLFGLEGSYRVDVRGWDNQGHFDTGWDVDHQWSGIVDTLAPRFSFTRTIDPDDPNLAHFSFSVEDTLLDQNSIHQNLCKQVNWTREYFNSSWHLATGMPPNTSLYRLSGTCSGDTRTTETTGFYACDIAGNCVMEEYPATMKNTVYLPFVMGGNGGGVPSSPAAAPQISPDQLERAMQWPTLTDTQDRSDGGQAPHVEVWTNELTPEDARSIFHSNLRGMVSDDDGQLDSVAVEILLGGEVIYTTTAGVYNGLWNAVWFYPPGSQPANGAYTVRVTAVDAAGNQTLVEHDILVHLLP